MRVETLLMMTPEREQEIARVLAVEREISPLTRLEPDDSLIEALVQYAPALLVGELTAPGENLLEWLDCVPEDNGPAVILLSPSAALARRAFDVGVTDFVLLPASPERLRRAFRRARARIRLQRLAAARAAEVAFDGSAKGNHHWPHSRVVGGSDGHIFFLAPEDISWIQAAQNYVELHVGDHIHRMRGTLDRLESRLEPSSFLRIHRSTIVNLGRVRELCREQAGEWQVKLDDGAILHASHRCLRRLLEVVGANALTARQ